MDADDGLVHRHVDDRIVRVAVGDAGLSERDDAALRHVGAENPPVTRLALCQHLDDGAAPPLAGDRGVCFVLHLLGADHVFQVFPQTLVGADDLHVLARGPARGRFCLGHVSARGRRVVAGGAGRATDSPLSVAQFLAAAQVGVAGSGRPAGCLRGTVRRGQSFRPAVIHSKHSRRGAPRPHSRLPRSLVRGMLLSARRPAAPGGARAA